MLHFNRTRIWSNAGTRKLLCLLDEIRLRVESALGSRTKRVVKPEPVSICGSQMVCIVKSKDIYEYRLEDPTETSLKIIYVKK